MGSIFSAKGRRSASSQTRRLARSYDNRHLGETAAAIHKEVERLASTGKVDRAAVASLANKLLSIKRRKPPVYDPFRRPWAGEDQGPPAFYVYQLVDPRNGLPFYVGKGLGNRAWQHEAAVRAGDRSGNIHKVLKIASILADRKRVEVQILARFHHGVDALAYERSLICELSGLTNIVYRLPGIDTVETSWRLVSP